MRCLHQSCFSSSCWTGGAWISSRYTLSRSAILSCWACWCSRHGSNSCMAKLSILVSGRHGSRSVLWCSMAEEDHGWIWLACAWSKSTIPGFLMMLFGCQIGPIPDLESYAPGGHCFDDFVRAWCWWLPEDCALSPSWLKGEMMCSSSIRSAHVPEMKNWGSRTRSTWKLGIMN